MSRWGEEEKKTKGLFGCAFAFTILGFALYIFWINYANLEGRRLMEKRMQDVVRNGYAKSEGQMIASLEEAAEELELPITEENIDLTKSLDSYGNPVVDVRIDFTFSVNVLVTEFEVSIPIAEEVTIVAF